MEQRKDFRRSRPVLRRRYHRPGTAPGTLINRQPDSVRETGITLIRYSEQHYEEKRVSSLVECWAAEQARPPGGVTWINIQGYHDPELLRELGEHYGLHPLTLEDVLNTGQRPKCESYGSYCYLVMYLMTGQADLVARQVSIFLGEGFVVTIEEKEEAALEPVRERLRQGSGTIRQRGSDYLCYCICDVLVDRLSLVLERIGAELDGIETELLKVPDRRVLSRLHRLKRELLLMARIVWAERELIDNLQREEPGLVKRETVRYLRDIYDHAVQFIDIIEDYRDMATGLVDIYLSSVSNQLNSIMKTLTIIATIFIPLTFIVGVYGMNFRYMPELGWRYGYAVVWLVMLAIAGGMLAVFRRRKWL